MSYLEKLKSEFSQNQSPRELTKPTEVPFVSSVSKRGEHIQEKLRWYPEMAAAGYVWCLDCRYWGGGGVDDPKSGTGCTHVDNPFKIQQPLVPRKCRWFDNQEKSND